MKAIPVPVRERILKLYDQGKSTGEIAASFGSCVAAVRPVRQHFQARGTLEPQTHRCGRKSLLTAGRHAGGNGRAVWPPHFHHGPVVKPAGLEL